MKTNIKMRVTPEQSKRVQEICFENGIEWRFNLKKISHINEPYLAIEPTALFYRSTENDYFSISSLFKEIDADLFIRTNGTCEESIGSKFQPSDEVIRSVAKTNGWDKLETSHYTMNMLLDNLKKKNEILKKARIKRKNQREELHKLNLKLQKCISLDEHHIKMKTILNEKHKLEVESNELSNFFDLCLGYPRDKRMPLSSYTEDLFRNSKKKQAILYECNLKQQREIEKLKAVIEYLESKVK